MRHTLIDLRALPREFQRNQIKDWDRSSYPSALIVVSEGVQSWWMAGRVITNPELAGGFR